MTKDDIIEKIKNIKDPEIGIDLWTLGLIYKIDIDAEGIKILMTLTSGFCPFADTLLKQVEEAVTPLLSTNSGQRVTVELTFDPPWKPSDELRLTLGL